MVPKEFKFYSNFYYACIDFVNNKYRLIMVIVSISTKKEGKDVLVD